MAQSPLATPPALANGRNASPLHLSVDALSVSFAARRILTGISFTVASGERAGLIGENGSGKSTLLRAAAGLIVPDRGFAGASGGEDAGDGRSTIGLLHQEPPFGPDVTVADALEEAVAPAREAAAEVNRAAAALGDLAQEGTPRSESAGSAASLAADRYARALENADRLDVWSIDARVASMLAGLGLGRIDLTRATGSLSGGQLARVSLAWLLLRAPEVLLLDEPTNHLDDAAIEHLCRVLERWRGPVLFASHDRAFLDRAATTLCDLDPAPLLERVASASNEAGSGMGVTRYTGTYTEYLLTRAETRARWERQYREEQAELARLRAGIGDSQQVGHEDWKPRTETRMAQKFYADRNARVVARRVNDVRARFAELEARQISKPVEQLRFVWPAEPSGHSRLLANPDPESAETTVTVTRASVHGRLAPVDLRLAAGEKLLITGPNGAGKSTLLALLSGALAPTKGDVGIRSGMTVGLLSQQVEIPDPDQRGPGRTAAEAYRALVGLDRAEEVPLATFGLLRASDETRAVAELSLGQQRRLALAILLASPPDLLLLDEPTNHLSLELVTALEAAIEQYPGTVVIASHDRWLRERWRGSRLALNE